MLLRWKEKEGSKATFQVLNDALCHHLVQNRDLAEKFCCDQFWDSEVDGICFPSFLTNNFHLERFKQNASVTLLVYKNIETAALCVSNLVL